MSDASREAGTDPAATMNQGIWAPEAAPAPPSLDYVRGWQDCREAGAEALRSAARSLRMADADERGIPHSMGVSWTGDELDAQAKRLAVLAPAGAQGIPPGLRVDPPPQDPRRQFLVWGIDRHAEGMNNPSPDARWMVVQWQRHSRWGGGYWAWAVPGRVTEVKVLGWLELPGMDIYGRCAAELTERAEREAAHGE